MVKKKATAAAANVATSATSPKATTDAMKKVAPEASAAAAKDAPGDWPALTMSKRDEKKACSLGMIPAKEGNVIQPDSIPLLALHEPYDLDHQPSEIPSTAEYFPIASEDEGNPEEGGSTANVECCTEVAEDSEALKGEDNDPANPEASSADHIILDDELNDTAVSNHDNDADRAPFVHASLEKSSAQPPKRPSGGFADEDNLLFDFDEGFTEPPSKKAKASPCRPTPAASEASGIQTAITILKDFASQFSFQADNARLQEDVLSMSSKLDQAVKFAATARQDADSLRKELRQLKKKLKEEEKVKAKAQAQKKEREDLLHKSTMALLEAADIPLNSVGKLPADSSADAISLAIESGDLVRALLQNNRVVLSRLHAMIFPKADYQKTLG
ncbi:hypothetical protein QYE76_036123 [Lolium multiflorum]|uniref:Uncharacterized protein n=1 Tax=Lolium multiflorum TaxID=4521 RepID=A0AAD8R0D1_LOLMU|nr:hypothetical protein QYE76_036123 [Lolium multiflorum]